MTDAVARALAIAATKNSNGGNSSDSNTYTREEIDSKIIDAINGVTTESIGAADENHEHQSTDVKIVWDSNTYDINNFINSIIIPMINSLQDNKESKTEIITDLELTTYNFDFSNMHNAEIRLQNSSLESISFTFGNGEYVEDYISGIVFNSGEIPTAIDYTDSGILNWVGTDCVTDNGISIFQPSANTHYDIVFYFNGTQFIGLVNGYVPATGNEVV